MGIIHVLDPQLTNMIAAGEVVDRPVNIVKELCENSLDAGAGAIDIEVFAGGIEGVIVSDDGCGMNYEDARMAFRRHATSKIRNEEELFAISTMGFRGEALPSIASVARVSMQTSDGQEGCHIEYEYGELKVWEKASAPRGCRIEVRGLFLHTPARFKYLKKPNYEFSIIADAVNKLALAHPEVRFSLKHDGRMIFQSAGRGDRREILYQMFGTQPAKEAVEFRRHSSDFTISGYAMQPTVSRANKSYIYLALNGRTIRSWPIVKAVIEGYREYLPKDRYPICFLNIEMDYQLVDVNVHPNKLEVRISKEDYLSQLIIDTISELFESEIQAPSIQSRKPVPEQLQVDFDYPAASGSRGDHLLVSDHEEPVQTRPVRSQPTGQPVRAASASSVRADSEQIRSGGRVSTSVSNGTSSMPAPDFLRPEFVRQTALPDFVKDAQKKEMEDSPQIRPVPTDSGSHADRSTAAQTANPDGGSGGSSIAPSYPAGQTPASSPERKKGNEFFRHLRVIGQLKDSYILCEGPDGLVIIDQHAAQERANFEKIQREFEKPVQVMQPLMVPLRISLAPGLMASLDRINEKTRPYGLNFEPLSQTSVLLREEPAWMSMVDRDAFLDDLFAWVQSHQDVDMKELRRHLIATCACHSSVRFHHALRTEEMEKVISDLVSCDQPYHCPHGRPTVVTMSLRELAKEFERV